MKTVINSVIYNTETAHIQATLEDNNKRVTYYFCKNPRGKEFIYIRNPYKQVVEIEDDNGVISTFTSSKIIIPMRLGKKTYYNFYKHNTNNHS